LNEIDLDDIPEKVREEMEFVLAEDMNDVLEHALVSPDKVEESDDEVVEPTSEPEPTPVAV
jgi:ATP-dependent Lon protease